MKLQEPKESPATHPDFLLLGLLLEGGAEKYVDIEHVAVRLHKIAPTQFRWRLYPEYPSLEAVQRAVGGIHSKYGESLMRAPHRKSTERMLTAEGINYAKEVAERLLGRQFASVQEVLAHFNGTNNSEASASQKQAIPDRAKRPIQRVLQAIRRHSIFKMWQEKGSLQDVELWELADLLTCLPDSPDSVWTERIERLRSQATLWQADDVSQFIKAVEEAVSNFGKGEGSRGKE